MRHLRGPVVVAMWLAVSVAGCNNQRQHLERPSDQRQAAAKQPTTGDGGDEVDEAVELNEVRTLDDIKANQGKLVQLVGLYEEVDVRKKQTGDPVLGGHVAVKLSDGSSVFLAPPWSDEAIRAESERAEFRGQRVVVSGLATDQCPEDPRGGASIISPCMLSVAGIVTEEFHEMFKQYQASE